ncbi:MAG: enoyl-CoA hydratase/isomerase family protein [Tepidiformaceae bacterium]
MTEFTDLEFEVDDPVAIIRLNRPEKLNAFTYHTLAEIRRAIDAAAADTKVVGIIITGNGRGFSAGLDSLSLAESTADGGRSGAAASASSTELPGLFTYFLDVPKPIIAAVNGVAAGGGLVLAAKCDVRIASTSASFTTVFLKRGLIAEHGMSWLLPRLVGPGAALDLLWTSKRIDAAEAHRIGLVDYVCEPGELLGRARAYIAEIASNAAPLAVADTKRLVYSHMGAAYPDAFRDADTAQWQALARPDALEGSRALLEKRTAVFQRLGE